MHRSIDKQACRIGAHYDPELRDPHCSLSTPSDDIRRADVVEFAIATTPSPACHEDSKRASCQGSQCADHPEQPPVLDQTIYTEKEKRSRNGAQISYRKVHTERCGPSFKQLRNYMNTRHRTTKAEAYAGEYRANMIQSSRHSGGHATEPRNQQQRTNQ
ncbi:hypothetical protein GCM10011494_39150 [Novosphingobium endophyticum]|uniref:Uncharacterized protein n=1 Tax=Novosphingobium endophyticum TaxID=1955250 RepID=A0A916TVT5_9SPHN|nr:hypothetical protein GCM10011494_39150 [Novosphingobium endophyticum]